VKKSSLGAGRVGVRCFLLFVFEEILKRLTGSGLPPAILFAGLAFSKQPAYLIDAEKGMPRAAHAGG
jgi:hypothetical protein